MRFQPAPKQCDGINGVFMVECACKESAWGARATCKLAIAAIGFLRAIRMFARMLCCVGDEWSSIALGSARQHFLKRDAVFCNVLVYSGCSAFRFPSARSY